MPYIFIGGDSPEARDYDSNYLFYDEDDIDSMESVLEVLQKSKKIDPALVSAARNIIKKAIEKKGNGPPPSAAALSNDCNLRLVSGLRALAARFGSALSALSALRLLAGRRICPKPIQ